MIVSSLLITVFQPTQASCSMTGVPSECSNDALGYICLPETFGRRWISPSRPPQRPRFQGLGRRGASLHAQYVVLIPDVLAHRVAVSRGVSDPLAVLLLHEPTLHSA